MVPPGVVPGGNRRPCRIGGGGIGTEEFCQKINGTITINPNSNRAGEFIAIHELTHAVQQKQKADQELFAELLEVEDD